MAGKKRKRTNLTAQKKKSSTKSIESSVIIPEKPPLSDSEQESEYEIEKIIDHRVNGRENRIEFLVRWKGYGPSDDTWESFEMFAYDAPQIVQNYLIEFIRSRNQKDDEEEKEGSVGVKRGRKKKS